MTTNPPNSGPAYPPPASQPGYTPPPPYGTPAPAQPGPPPPPAWAPQNANPADPPRVSPPPPPITQVPPAKAGPVAWLVPLGALLAVIGVFTPWFDPTVSRNGTNIPLTGSALYSWKDGKIGLLAPIILVGVAVGVVGLIQGRTRGRFANGAEPIKSAGKYSIIAGAVSIVCLVIAWFLVPGQFTFTADGDTASWSKLEKLGFDLGRGPEIGYWLTGVGAVLAIVGGVLMLVTYKPQPVAPQGQSPYGAPAGAGYPSPGGGFQPPSLQKQPPQN